MMIVFCANGVFSTSTLLHGGLRRLLLLILSSLPLLPSYSHPLTTAPHGLPPKDAITPRSLCTHY
jgi:hypothetical protein